MKSGDGRFSRMAPRSEAKWLAWDFLAVAVYGALPIRTFSTNAQAPALPQGMPKTSREAEGEPGCPSGGFLWANGSASGPVWLVGNSPAVAGPSAGTAQAKGICRASKQSPKGMSENARTRKSQV